MSAIHDFQFFRPKRIQDDLSPLVPRVPIPFSPYISDNKDIAVILLQFLKGPLAPIIKQVLYAGIRAETTVHDIQVWIASFIALAYQESRLNPKAENKSIVTYEGKSVSSHAYGLFQQTKSNWRSSVEYLLNKTNPSVKSLLLSFLTKNKLGTALSDVLRDRLGTGAHEVTQVVAQAGMMLSSIDYIKNTFVYKDGTWMVNPSSALSTKISQSPRWNEFVSSHRSILTDFYDGRLAILSLIQANGKGFYKSTKLYHMHDTNRLIATFHSILDSDDFRDFTSSLGPASHLIGDPASPLVISSGWGKRITSKGGSGFHKGLDLPKPVGTPVYSLSDGIVETLHHKQGGNTVRVYGTTLPHYWGYAHLDRYRPFPKGYAIKKGELIGYVGSTGVVSTGPHLHLSHKRTRTGPFVDPLLYWKPEFLSQVWVSYLPPTITTGKFSSTFSHE